MGGGIGLLTSLTSCNDKTKDKSIDLVDLKFPDDNINGKKIVFDTSCNFSAIDWGYDNDLILGIYANFDTDIYSYEGIMIRLTADPTLATICYEQCLKGQDPTIRECFYEDNIWKNDGYIFGGYNETYPNCFYCSTPWNEDWTLGIPDYYDQNCFRGLAVVYL